MKNYQNTCLVLFLVFLAGCNGGKKTQISDDKMGKKIAMPLAKDKKDGSMLLSFFDDEVNAFEDVESFVLDEDSPAYDDSIKVVQSGNDSFALQEAVHIDEEKAIIYFDYDSNTIRDDQNSTVRSLKKQLSRWIKKGYKVVFRGHSCRWSPKGDSVYNMILSNDRAVCLANALGVPEEKRMIVGLGYEEPVIIESVKTKEGQAPNRRVEIYPIAA